MHGLI